MLFVSGGAVSVEDLADALKIDKKTVRRIAKGLADSYEVENRGVKIIEIDDSYQMCSNPEYFEYIEALGKAPKKKVLTQAIMETLAIIAYKQPCTKTDIENIRGVSADHAVNKLLDLGLISEIGRAETPGRPVVFGTSEEFLRSFGITDLSGLPKLPANEIIE